jgi:genome maintenance exonuclease 1
MNKTFNHIPPPQNIQELNATTEGSGRFYQTPDKQKYPSVTTVCGFEKAHFFAQWRKDNPEEARRTSERGNILHEAIERYVKNEDIGELANMKRNVDRIDNVRAQEVALWSNTLRLAGRVDCVAEFDGKLSIIDFKGSTRRKSPSKITNYFCQATAYAIMWHEMMNEAIEQVVILISCEDGASQVFVKDPKEYVPELRRSILMYEAAMAKKNESPELFGNQ